MFWFICGVFMGIYLDQTFTIPNIQKTFEKYKDRKSDFKT
jgi:hypothetical protein|tara:strand:+ start:252 stop:371 length:120 start_codon:yes stop_codon:yes gene_type:complete